MRIYPINMNIKLPIQDIHKYLQTEYQTLLFNTNEGKIEIHNNRIYKFTEFPPRTLHRFSKELSFHIQLKEDVKKEVYYIPIDYKYNKIFVRKYKLNKNSLLTMITENNESFYFETTEPEITTSVKEDMNTFLSTLKLYN